MAQPKLGILGQGAPAAATNSDIYTVPASRRAVISTIAVAETGGGITTYRLHARINGAAAGAGNAIAYDSSISPNQHLGYTEGVTLAAGDVLTVRSATGAVTFTAFGEETDVPGA